MHIAPDTKIAVSRQVMSQEIRGETVLLDLESENYFGLDVVGTRVWQLLGEGLRFDEVMSVLLSEYDVSKDKLESDVSALLERLQKGGLIHFESQSG